jgi:hypothetical protein
MDKSPQMFAFIGLGVMAAVAIVVSMIRGRNDGAGVILPFVATETPAQGDQSFTFSLFGSNQSDAPSATKPKMDRASHLATSDLHGAMDSLEAGQRGYITFGEYEQLSGINSPEFSSSERDIIREMSATAHCEILVSDAAQRVYFTKRDAVN